MLLDWAFRIESGGQLDRNESESLPDLAQKAPWDLLYGAWRIRQSRFGRKVRLCSIVPGKLGGCSEDCHWCAQSAKAQENPKTVRTNPSQIVQAAENAKKLGSGYLGVVNSGRTPSCSDIQAVVDAAEEIQERLGDNIGICASLGELTEAQAEKLAKSNIVRYHHNLETSRRFFPQVVSTHDYASKVKTLQNARKAGLSLCCGGIFGLGETWADRVELAWTLREQIQPDVVPLNFLCPMPDTPLEASEPMKPMDILMTIAIFRYILPEVDIKMAGGREKNLGDLQSWIFFAGATRFMIGDYLTTAGRDSESDLAMLKELDMQIVRELSKGD